jgi:hypothetical protein
MVLIQAHSHYGTPVIISGGGDRAVRMWGLTDATVRVWRLADGTLVGSRWPYPNL